MSAPNDNPLLNHPAFRNAAGAIGQGQLGRVLSVFASGRSKRCEEDPLVDLGAPLLDFLLTTLIGTPISVTATRAKIAGPGDDGWFLVLRFADGLVATIDLGSFLPDAYPVETELRLEICGSEQVIVVDPANVAVTVVGRNGTRRDDAYAEPWNESVRRYAAAIQAGEVSSRATAVIVAARRSAANGVSVNIDVS